MTNETQKTIMTESEFQEKCREFVSQNVNCCVSSIVDYVLKKSIENSDAPFTYDDIENLERVNYDDIRECLEKNKEIGIMAWLKNNKDAESQYQFESISDELLTDYCSEAGIDIEDFQEPQEIYEWWIVSDWLIEKLKAKGEPVLVDECIWGRTATGQAILMDGVIREIVKEEYNIETEK